MPKFKITERGINFLLIFILGFLVGVAVKSEAQKRLTIGFNDYLVPKYKQDINPMKVPVQSQAQGQSQNQNPETQPVPSDSANQ